MSPNKVVFACLLSLVAMTSFAQSLSAPVTDAETITLDEYAKVLALKLKQQQTQATASSGTVPAIKAGAIPLAPGDAVSKPQKVAAPNPFEGWSYNGATLDATTKQALFGEVIVAGQRRLIYSGDVLAQSWRVTTLAVAAVEFKNVACDMAAKAAPRKKSAPVARSEQMCSYRLTRKV